MKILHCITCIDDAGGAEKLMEDLLPGLRHFGCDVSCLVFNGFDSKNRKKNEEHGVKVYELGHNNNHYYNPLYIFKLIRYVRKYNIIHTHNTPAVIFTAIANIFGNATLVTTVHSTEGKLRHKKGLKWFDRWIYNQYHYVICCSKAAEDSFKTFVHPKRPLILTINNGVKLQKFIEAQPLSEISKIACKKIIMVAWFRFPKNHRTVMDAIKKLPDDYQLFFVGAGTNLEECIEYAKNLDISQRVHFLGLRTDVPELLKAADYVVLSSHYEGLSLSSVEGMAAGKPFIASDVNGLKEIVGGAGVLFPDGDAEKLADIILKLDSDPVYYKEVAEKCYQRALQYDISTMIKGYKKIYQEIENNHYSK